jgi:hypothetical protein
MGTRGFIGYKHNKQAPKGFYHHMDSHPSYLGDEVLKKANAHTGKELLAFFKRIKWVKEEENREAYDNHKSIFDHDWNKWVKEEEYREAYDNHKSIFDHDWNTFNPILVNGGEFYKDGLFCEYAYIFNFDNATLEFYTGFGTEPTTGLEKWVYESFNSNNTKYYVKRAHVFKLKDIFSLYDGKVSLTKLVKVMELTSKLARNDLEKIKLD